MKTKTKILGVFTGKPKRFVKDKLESAFIKNERDDSVRVSFNELDGDQVSNLKYHGGANRVIHNFAAEHYEFLKNNYPNKASEFVSGSYGENIVTSDMTETNVCIGDIYRIGSTKLQVTEPRFPCGLIDMRFGIHGMFKRLLKAKKIGWFYRVLEEGEIQKGDSIELLERPYPDFVLDKVIDEIALKKEPSKWLEELIKVECFSDNWKDKAKKICNSKVK